MPQRARFVYQKFTNVSVNADRYLHGYSAGDPLCLTYLGEVEVSFDPGEREDVPLLACEVLFAKHNADDRPDGRICPSMSVGDVVALQDQLVRNSPVEYYACQTVGFVKLLDKPVHTTTDFWTVLADEMRRRASSWRS